MCQQGAAVETLLMSNYMLVQLAGVQYVLDTVTQALALNKDRTFIYGEIVSIALPLARSFCKTLARNMDDVTRCS